MEILSDAIGKWIINGCKCDANIENTRRTGRTMDVVGCGCLLLYDQQTSTLSVRIA